VRSENLTFPLSWAVAAGLVVVLVLGSTVCLADDAWDPYADYLADHPEESEESLLEPNPGDSIRRVLAVLYHPETNFNPQRLSFRSSQPGAPALDLAAYMSLATDAQQRDWLVSITPSCPTAWPLHSWLYAVEGQLLAFRLTAYRADCRPELDLIETSDHKAMRVVGARLFRSNQRGSFLYGPLRYERWDEAFAAPTEQAMLSILAGGFRAARRSAGANNRYAVGLYAVGRRKEALVRLHRAAELAPKWALPHANLAIAYRQAGELEAAEAADRAARERRIPPPQGDIKGLR